MAIETAREQKMKLSQLPFNWFDSFLLIWLAMGIFLGRKRGMSVEVLTFLQWFGVVIICGVTYEPAATWLVQTSDMFSPLFSSVLAYLLIAGLVALAFSFLKRSLGSKLAGSDTFGKTEYYLGMLTGMVRFACMLIFALALLNARFYTPQEIKASKKFQMDNYDSEFFPGLQTLQASVFEESFTGPPIKRYLGFILIAPKPATHGKTFKQQEWKGP